MLTPSRLALARKRRGLTLVELGRQVGITAQSLSNAECGRQSLSNQTLDRIAEVLDYPTTFFLQEDLEELTPDQVTFRARSKTSARAKNAVLSSARIVVELQAWIEELFDLPVNQVPTVDRKMTPSVAAEYVRARWGLNATQKVANMVKLLESRGVAVYSIPPEYADVDAFSFCWRAKPFVMLNTMKTPERSRFDAAHELGHLVLHSERNQCSESKVLEREANEFASAFLMPELSVRQHFGESSPTTDQVIRSKLKWCVAALALTYRLHELEILSDWNYRQMLLRLGSLGYGTGEPEGINQRESSAILRKVLDSLRHDKIPFSKISHDLAITPNELAKLMFGLAIAPVDGQKNVNQVELTMKETPILRVMPGGRCGTPTRSRFNV